jgi:cytochrome c oxidase assembly factor CtaG
VLGLILLTAAAAVCLLFGAAQAAAGRDYRWILWPLRVFLVIGAVGQSVDLSGGGLTAGHLVGFAILAAVVLPVVLLSTAPAKRYLIATGP